MNLYLVGLLVYLFVILPIARLILRKYEDIDFYAIAFILAPVYPVPILALLLYFIISRIVLVLGIILLILELKYRE